MNIEHIHNIIISEAAILPFQGEIAFAMAQATFSIRMDEKLKKQFDILCEDFGMNATTAFNVFARTVVRERKIPFEIVASASTVVPTFDELEQMESASGAGTDREDSPVGGSDTES